MRKPYPDDLTDEEWGLIEPFLEEQKVKQGRSPKYSRREILNAIFYVLRTGCQWRNLPHDFPPWSSVYTQFWRWDKKGIIKSLHNHVRRGLRELLGRAQEATGAIVDSQSVKTTERGALKVLTPGKRLKGGKDTYWLIQKVVSLKHS